MQNLKLLTYITAASSQHDIAEVPDHWRNFPVMSLTFQSSLCNQATSNLHHTWRRTGTMYCTRTIIMIRVLLGETVCVYVSLLFFVCLLVFRDGKSNFLQTGECYFDPKQWTSKIRKSGIQKTGP